MSLLDEFKEQNEDKLLDKELHRELLVRFSTPEDLVRIEAKLGGFEPLDGEQRIVSLVRAIELTGQRGKILHHLKNTSPEPVKPPKMEQMSGWWRFDEGSGSFANDSSGNNNVGELSDPSPNWITGLSGLRFDGSTFVKVPTASSLEPKNLTVAMWAKGKPQGTLGTLISKGRDGTAAASFALYTGNNGGLQFYIYDGNQEDGIPEFSSPEQPSTIWDDQWFHVVGSYDGLKVRLYINGDEVLPETKDVQTTIEYDFSNSPTPHGLPIEVRRDLRIGTYYEGLGGIFVGEIDDVMLWNVALTSEEIKTLADLAEVLNSLGDEGLKNLIDDGDFNLGFFVESDAIVEKAHTDQALIDKLMEELPHSIVFKEDPDEKLRFDSKDSSSAEKLADLNVHIQAFISGGPKEERNETKIWLGIRSGEYKFKQDSLIQIGRADSLIQIGRADRHKLLRYLFERHPRQLMIEFRAQIGELGEVIERLSHLDNERHPFFPTPIHNVLSGLTDEELQKLTEHLSNSTNGGNPVGSVAINDSESLTTTLSIFQLKSENKKELAELHYVIDPTISGRQTNRHRVRIDRGSDKKPSIVPFSFSITQELQVALSNAKFDNNVRTQICPRENQHSCQSDSSVPDFTMAISIPHNGAQSVGYNINGGMIVLVSGDPNSPAQTIFV